jgi:CheY-like chemotaxis protein
MILTDKTWFQENILCLVSNAVKYSGDGEITVTLKLVSIDGEGSSKKIHLCVEIEDCGIGLSDEAKSKLFQPFNQAQRAAGGTGLGLFSLLQRMIALNGSCGVKNREDGQQGSVFWFQFPYKPDDAAAKDLEQMKSMKVGGVSDNSVMRVVNPLDASMSGTGESGLRSLRVLLVDDSLVILRVIQKALLRAGHVVDSAENGALGLKALESAVTPYDVVISDIQMPVMDGYEFCRRVRLGEDMQSDLNESSSRRQLMIGMSANTAGDAQRDAVAAGLDAFIGKPFNINDVTQLLLKYPSFRVHDRAFEAGLLQDLGLFEHSEGFWANGLG